MAGLNDPSLVKAANRALLEVAPKLTIWKNFALDMSDEFAEPGETVKVPVASVDQADAFDAEDNNFEKADGTLTWETVTMSDPIKATWKLTESDIRKMPTYMDAFGKASAQKIAKTLDTAIGGLFNSTSVTTTAVVLPELIELANVASLRSQTVGKVSETVLILSPKYYNQILALAPANIYGTQDAIKDGYISNLFGFKAVVEAELPDGVEGALLPSERLVLVTRAWQPADPGAYTEVGQESDPDNKFTLTVTRHGDPATGSAFLNTVCLYGLKLIRPDSDVKLIVTETDSTL